MVASVQSDRSYLPDALLNGVYAAAEAAGYHLMLSKLPDEKLTSEGFVPKILRELMVDGLLIDYINQVPTRMMELIHQYVIPSVLINSKQQTDCVYPADFDAGRRATARLLELGHRKITYVDYSASGHYSAFDRCHGYVAAMKDAGLTPQPLRSERVQSARESLVRSMQILEAADRPTAVVACGQEHAIAMLRAAERKQIRVPQDLSLLTFGDALTDDPCLSITTLQIPEYDIGKLATNMLLRKISGGNAVQAPMVVPFEWAHGESCARVN
jgi:LacI family transcriptional regulator